MTQEADLDYILTTVLGQKADSPIHKSLSRAGIDNVPGIMSLAEQHIKNLKYKKDSALGKAVLTGLPNGHLQRLICFKAYIQMKLKAGVMVHEDWQNNVTKDEFQEFQVTGHVPDIAAQILNLCCLTVTSSGTCHQDVTDILENKTTTKDHLKQMAIL